MNISLEPQKRMNCFKLLRHPFITGKVPLSKDITYNGDFRIQKKLLSAISENEEINLAEASKNIKENDFIHGDDGNKNFSLTRLENQMIISIVESDVNYLNKCSGEDISIYIILT